MSVSYDRSRFYSFVLHGGESHLLPVVARVLELDVSDGTLSLAEPVSPDVADDLQSGTLGDVNVSSLIAVVESLPSLVFPDDNDVKLAKSKQILDDVLSLVAIAHRRFRKSSSWPVAAVESFLGRLQ